MRNYPGLGITGDFTPGEDGWSDEMNANLLKLSVTGQLTVLSIVSAVPGSPTDGDIHLMADDAGAHPDEIAVRDDGAWVYFVANDGWRLFNLDTLLHMILIDGVWTEVETGGGGLTDAPSDGDTYGRKDGAWVAIEAGTAAYRAGSFFTTTPGADEVLMDHPATDEFTLPADLVGSVFLVGVNPSADTTFSLQVDAVEVGTIEVTSGGVVTFDTAATPVVVAVDSHLTLVGPADANDIEGCAWTFRGTAAAVEGGGGIAFSGARVYNGADYARTGGTNEAMLDTTATVEYDTDSWWSSADQGFIVPAGVSYVIVTAQRAITSGTVGLRLGIDGAASLAALIGDTSMTFLQGTSGVIAVTPADLIVPMTFGSGAYTLQGDDIGWTWAEIRAIG